MSPSPVLGRRDRRPGGATSVGPVGELTVGMEKKLSGSAECGSTMQTMCRAYLSGDGVVPYLKPIEAASSHALVFTLQVPISGSDSAGNVCKMSSD